MIFNPNGHIYTRRLHPQSCLKTCRQSHDWSEICGNITLPKVVAAKTDKVAIASNCTSVTTPCSHSHDWSEICGNIALPIRVVAKADEVAVIFHCTSVTPPCSHSHDWSEICGNIAFPLVATM